MPLAGFFCILLHGAVASVEITNPSLTFPTDVEALDSEWYRVGPTEISMKGNSLVINPAVVDYPSLVWSRERIPSDNFEVTIVLGAILPSDDVNSMFDFNGVGFWYVYEGPESTKAVTARNDRRKNKKKAGKKGRFQLFGYKDDYDGLGSFLFFDGGSPMMTLLANTPPEKITREDATGATEGIGLYEAFHTDKTKSEIKIKLRVQPNRASVEVLGHQGGKLEVEGSFKAGGYIGLTAASASYEKDDSLVPSLVEIKDLKVRSFVPLVELPPDPEAKIPEEPPSEPELPEAPAKEEVAAAEEPPIAANKGVADDLGRPAVAAGRHVESGLREELRALQRMATTQQRQLDNLQKDVAALRAEL